jgi:hypothetical protein
MRKCFSYPLKAENKEAFLCSGRLLGRGPQLYGAADPPPSFHPCKRPTTPPPTPQEGQPGLSQPPPTPSLAQPPPTSCPKQEGKCAWVVAGWVGTQREKVLSTWPWLRGSVMVLTCWRVSMSRGLCGMVTDTRWPGSSGDSAALWGVAFTPSIHSFILLFSVELPLHAGFRGWGRQRHP